MRVNNKEAAGAGRRWGTREGGGGGRFYSREENRLLRACTLLCTTWKDTARASTAEKTRRKTDNEPRQDSPMKRI